MESKVQVLVFIDSNSGEPPEVYRLDEAGEGDRFFRNLITNIERDENHSIRLEEWSLEKWQEAEKLGRYLGGDMDEAEESAFLSKN